MKTAGTRARIIERNRYAPASPRKAIRKIRVVSEDGRTQTHKKKGDLVIVNPYVKSFKVKQDGWY